MTLLLEEGQGLRVWRTRAQIRTDFEGLTLVGRGACPWATLGRLPEGAYQALQEAIALLRTGRSFTHMLVPRVLLERVISGELDFARTVTRTDLGACVRRRLCGGQYLDLRLLQNTKRSFLGALRHILGAWYRLHIRPRREARYDFAFMVHPRNHADIVRGIPLLRFLGERWARAVVKRLPPHKLSDMTGLSDVDGRPLRGVLLGLGWDRDMFEQHSRGREVRIAEMVHLARRMGIRYVGLGALLPWASRYGHCLDGTIPRSELETSGWPESRWGELVESVEGVNLVPRPPAEVERALEACDLTVAERLRPLFRRAHASKERFSDMVVTTGHPLTVSVIASLVRRLFTLHPNPSPCVAIVGAAGSTGSCCSLKLARDGSTRFLLVDRAKSTGVTTLHRLREDILSISPSAEVRTTHDILEIIDADIIVVVSSANGIIIQSQMLKSGAIVVDDSQPRNVDPNIATTRKDICILTVLAQVDGLNPNFRFDRHTPMTDASFTCAADVALRAMTRSQTSAIGQATLEGIDRVESMAETMRSATGLDVLAPIFFTYERRHISEAELSRIAALARPVEGPSRQAPSSPS